jgi:hypothetical protein
MLSSRRERLVAAIVIAVGLLAVAALLVVGNTAHDTETWRPQTTGTDPTTGIIGKLTYSGGPPPGLSTHAEPGEVVVYPLGGGVVASVSVQEGDGFSIPLDPGTWRVSATSGDADCQDITVNVRANRLTDASIVCSVI